MPDYGFLNLPTACNVGNTIYKKLFYGNADLSAGDKALFTDVINKVGWLYCLKPETINIKPYKNDIRYYPEMEVLEVEVLKDAGLKRIAEIIMRAIPYPMLLFFRLYDKMQLYAAHQRTNQNDSSRNTIEEIVCTGWLEEGSPLFEKLDIKQMRFTNFFTLYSDIVDAVSIFNISDLMLSAPSITGEEARRLSNDMETIEQRISDLKAKIRKETQFNRKMEMNIEIKKLEKEKINLVGGYKNDRDKT